MDDQKDLESSPETPVETSGEAIQPEESPTRRNWPMFVVGAAMLVIGLVLGYLGRGVYGPEASAAKATSSAMAAAVQTRASANKAVMDVLIEQTRHFKGSPNAPVTIIEFSDFQ